MILTCRVHLASKYQGIQSIKIAIIDQVIGSCVNSYHLKSTAEVVKPHDTLRSLLHNIRGTSVHGKDIFVVNNTNLY
jgi:hypothetical protein